ncbi:IPT/TIG domain-containing protein [Polaribacter sp. AHE13PA]|jgi:hypothetical protein|uniref:IPT/TIG domain-containing protein n=1 Tax=Polaribacter sp. AHE13PA TaxID=2745562 RepID=UPI001C4E63ED|nr:IPT/TIG domain-containing protein [Polaribacter sp. AHE13PA]QXP65816.1 hypothetical protein H0I28_11515 [Polaribacter sp. AHE13PA]
MNLSIGRFRNFFIILIIILITIISCSEEVENGINNEIVLETLSNKNINEGGVVLNGSFINVSEHVDFGFVLSTIEGETYNRRGIIKLIENVPQGNYSAEIRTGLKIGQKYYFNVFIFLNGEYLFGQERVFISNGSSIPIIKELSSNKLSLLDTLIIKGSYFSKNPKIYFSDVESTPLVSSDSLIKVIVPFPKNNYLSTAPYSRIKIINQDKQENTINDFSLNTPRIDSIIPRKITDSDTLRIYGDYFDAKRSNMVITISDNQQYSYSILESTKNKIVLKPSIIRKKNPTLVVRSQLSSVVKQMEVLMPEITSISTNCISFEDDLVIKGANFPLNNDRHIIKLEDSYLSPYIKTRDSLVFKIGNGYRFKDFKDNKFTVNYLNEVTTAKDKICIDEPWLKVNYDYEGHNVLKMYDYNDDIYALGSTYTNWDIVKDVFKLNKSNLNFEKVTDENFHKEYSSNTGRLNVFYKDKMYSKKYVSSEEDVFISYNIFTNEKKVLADFPGEIREYGFMIVVGDYIYTGLGVKYFKKPMTDIWRYSIIHNSWEKIIDKFPEITSYDTSKLDPFVFAEKSKIYIGSGQGNKQLDFWELDTSNNKITRKANLPIAFKDLSINSGLALFVENKTYFHFQSMFEYDSNNDIWKNYITNGERYNNAGYFYLDNEIYMKYDRAIYKFNSEYLK